MIALAMTSSRLTAIILSSTKNNATFIIGQINIIMSHGVPLGVLQILSNVKLMRLSRNLYDISYMRCLVFFLLPMVTIHLKFPRCMYDILSFRSIQVERGDFPCPIANRKRPERTSFPLPKFLRFHNDTVVKTLRFRPKKRDRLSRREFMRKHGNSYVLQKNSDIKNFIRVLLPVLTDNRQDAPI